MRRFALGASTCAMLVCGPAVAATELLTRQLDAAEAALPQVAREGPWLHVCEGAAETRRCRYEQTARAENGVEVVLTLLAPSPGDEIRAPVALFRTPLDVMLPPGLAVRFDGGAPGRVEFRACNPGGCLASIVLEGTVRSRVARSNRMAVQFISQTLEPVTIEFSLARSAAILSQM